MTSQVVFVTGAAGFVGYHAARHLIERGNRVIACDNFNTYYDPRLKRERAKLLQILGVTVLEQDICARDLPKLLKKEAVTHVLHLAAQAGVRYSLEQPLQYIHSNIEGFVNVLEAARQLPGVKVVYASSSSVYGTNRELPYRVEARCDSQASLYGATKKSNETIAQAYHNLYGIDITGLRYFTVYGPWGRPDMAYYSFTRAISEGQPITLFNEGKMSRDFTYIDDIVTGTLAALDRCEGCCLYNLGNHRSVALKDFVKILEKAIGRTAQIEYLPMQPGDVQDTFADIELSQKNLDWTPSTPLEEGLPRFVEWYLNYTDRVLS